MELFLQFRCSYSSYWPCWESLNIWSKIWIRSAGQRSLRPLLFLSNSNPSAVWSSVNLSVQFSLNGCFMLSNEVKCHDWQLSPAPDWTGGCMGLNLILWLGHVVRTAQTQEITVLYSIAAGNWEAGSTLFHVGDSDWHQTWWSALFLSMSQWVHYLPLRYYSWSYHLLLELISIHLSQPSLHSAVRFKCLYILKPKNMHRVLYIL